MDLGHSKQDYDVLWRLAEIVDEALEFQSLFETKEPYVWLSLSQNANTPVDILIKLLEATNIKNARAIRHSANVNLQGKRHNNSEVIT